MEEPGRLQSMGSLLVRHDWAISLSLFTFMHRRRKWQPTQCSCLENPRGGGAWWAAVYGVAQSQTRLKQLSSSSSSIVVLVVKNLPANAGGIRETQVRSLGLEDPLEEGMAIHSNILVWESHGQRSLVDYSPWGGKESAMTEETLAQHSKYIFLRKQPEGFSFGKSEDAAGGICFLMFEWRTLFLKLSQHIEEIVTKIPGPFPHALGSHPHCQSREALSSCRILFPVT